MYNEVVEKEYERALSIPLQMVEVAGQEIVLFRADTLPAGIKTSIGKCLLAHYMDNGQVNNQIKSIVVVGGGNTVQGVKLAVDEFGLCIKVVAVVYAETSRPVIKKLKAMGIEVVMETPRCEGRTGRLSTAERLCRKQGWVLLEQHEQPLIVDIQRRTFGRAIVERLGTSNHFVAGVGTGGTLFGIGSALREANPCTRIIAVEGVGSTLTLWHTYLCARNTYEAKKRVIEKALRAYKVAGMLVSLTCYPRRKPENWFDISIDFPTTSGIVGIEGLGVGDPTRLVLDNLPEVNKVRIVTDEEAKEGIRSLRDIGINAVESAGANFLATTKLAKNLQRYGKRESILTIITASRER